MRTIKEALNIQTGELFKTEVYLSNSEETLFKGRNKLEKCIQKGKKLVVCPYCLQPLALKGTPKGAKSIYFSHLYDSGDCPYKSNRKYTKDQLLRMKYNGIKESDLHIHLKASIARILSLDSRFTDIKDERRFSAKGLSKKWKRPDVQAKFNGQDIVFEIQLSTTFLSTIVTREMFYMENGAYMIWFFYRFNIDEEKQKFTEKDIIYSNNNNAFVINEETIQKSLESQKFIFQCCYQEPFVANDKVLKRWRTKEICFDDLQFDTRNYKTFYFDTEGETKKLKYKLKYGYLDEFEAFWIDRHELPAEEEKRKVDEFSSIFSAKGIRFDFENYDLGKFLDAIYSLKHRRMIGYKFKNFLSLANCILEHKKEYSELFISAMERYGFFDIVLKEDKKDSFKKKLRAFEKEAPEQNEDLNEIMSVLFPDL